MKNEFFNGDKIHDGLSSRQYRSGRKERAPDREECQYANCAIAETRWTRTSPIGENRKGKGKIQRKEKKWRGKRGKRLRGRGTSNIPTNTSGAEAHPMDSFRRPLRAWATLFFHRRPIPYRSGYFGLVYCILVSSVPFFNIIIHFTIFLSF
jgi:hypothetical protein